MTRIGFFPFVGTGHLNPAIALGRRLSARGYEIVFFHLPSARAAIRAAGLGFCPLTDDDLAPKSYDPRGLVTLLEAVRLNVQRVLRGIPNIIKEGRIDAAVVDQYDLAGGTVADILGVPSATIAVVPPFYLSDEVYPPFFRGSPITPGAGRNRRCNVTLSKKIAPICDELNKQRRVWGLPQIGNVNELWSKLAFISQLPKSFDFPHSAPTIPLFYSGPFSDEWGRYRIDFPWNRINGKPLVYASMGTIRNDSEGVFQLMVQTCSEFNVQLVLSLGGGGILPEQFDAISGDAIIVHYAPQLELLRRACLTITHAGINTTLESLAEGVPLVAVPVTDDQPGVAARIEWTKTGLAVPYRRLSKSRLQTAIDAVLGGLEYKAAAVRLQEEIRQSKGVELAADIIEQNVLRMCSRPH